MLWALNVILFISTAKGHYYSPLIIVKPERGHSKSIKEADKQRSCLH